MELLLNLAWLLLAVPAYWLWRGSCAQRKFSSLQCLLALGCMLVILFPVISATDDLRAMRTEMEESPVSKRTLRQASGDKGVWSFSWQTAAVAPSHNAFLASDDSWQQWPRPNLSLPAAPAINRAGRSPPRSFLG